MVKQAIIPVSVILSAIANLLIVTLFARGLKPEVYAQVVNIKTLILILASLLSLGLAQSYVFYFAKDKVNVEIENRQLKIVAMLAVVACCIASTILFTLEINMKSQSLFHSLFFIVFVLVMVNNELINYLRAAQKFVFVSYFIILRSISLLLVSWFVLLFAVDATSYLLALVLAELIVFGTLCGKRDFKSHGIVFPKSYFTYGLIHCLIISVTFAFNFLDRIIISVFDADLVKVAEYDLATIVPLAMFGLLGRTFNMFMFPVLSGLKEDVATLVSVFRKFLAFYVICSNSLVVLLNLYAPVLADIFFQKKLLNWDHVLINSILAYHYLGIGAMIATVMYVSGEAKGYFYSLFCGFILYIAIVLMDFLQNYQVNVFSIPSAMFNGALFSLLVLSTINMKRVGIFNQLMVYSSVIYWGLL